MQTPSEQYRLSSPLVPQLYCWVTVDSKFLRVLDAKQDGIKTTTFVEAREGECYEVGLCDQRTKRPTSGYMTAVAKSLLTDRKDGCFSRSATDDSRFAIAEGTRKSATSAAPFAFPVRKGSSSRPRGGISGSIKLVYWHATDIKPASKTWSPPGFFLEEQKSSPFKYVDGEYEPVFVLEFQYRDAAYLRKQGLLDPEVKLPPPHKKVVKPSTASERLEAGGAGAGVEVEELYLLSFRLYLKSGSRLSALKSELETLRRQQRMADLEKEIEQLEEMESLEGELREEEGRLRGEGGGAKKMKLE
ncbi:hypothetical protein JCM8547_003234 [Rhodosporidiobolus lusitaniae]